MKKSLSRQFIAILLIPILIILGTNYYTIAFIRKSQNESLIRYCTTTLDNIEINISTMVTSMKKLSTMFSANRDIQEYLLSDSKDIHKLPRQAVFDLVELSKSYIPDLVDVVLWDKYSSASIINYLSADMERFLIGNFKDTGKNTESYFEFYVNPKTDEPNLIYFSTVSVTAFSENFRKPLGNIAIICKTNTLYKLVNSTSDMHLDITDTKTGQILYSNMAPDSLAPPSDKEFYKTSHDVTATNLSVTGTVYTGQIHFFRDIQSGPLVLLAVLSFIYIIYIAFAVQRFIIRPIYRLNGEIEDLDYENENPQIQTSLKNEIGSIASHVNSLLVKISSLNQHNIASQARLYEMELNKNQTQLYAYQSQINPHFLYNMLQCMRGISLMHKVPEVAQICTNMAGLFRYSIKGDFLVNLEDELNIIDKYLYMIRVRFQERITYRLDIGEDTRQCKIPKMILQPLVENSIFHGLESIEENGEILIRTFRERNGLYITIHDNGIGFDERTLDEINRLLAEDISKGISASFQESPGLGIRNIHNKIRLYEGNEYGVRIESRPRDTVVTLYLNAGQESLNMTPKL